MFGKCKAFKAAEAKMTERKESYARTAPHYKKMVQYGSEKVIGREKQ